MTAPPGGNVRLRAARRERGLISQADFVGALTAKATELGLGPLSVTTRTVRRWESDNPGWPHRPHVEALEALFGLPITDLGFTPRSERISPSAVERGGRPPGPILPSTPEGPTPPPHFHEMASAQATAKYTQMTTLYSDMYWHVPAKMLQQSIFRHAELGTSLLAATGTETTELATPVALAWMLAGRVLLFDLHRPSDSRACFTEALECARLTEDESLGAAALGHLALAVMREDAGDLPHARELIRSARSLSRRGGNPARLQAWLDTIEADIASRAGDHGNAATLIAHAEQSFRGTDGRPPWLDWFTTHRMAIAKANTLLSAGRLTDARMALDRALNELPTEDVKTRALTLCDLAAVHAVGREPEQAAALLTAALDEMGPVPSAALSRRIHTVRTMLDEWTDSTAVHKLDDRLSAWDTTITAATA
ncbi:helix-turn-helix transcriptional regulator [Mycobacterium hackensackense]|uniref:helix-turn-helix transcriptional regulator n=1 Tax=Mycobacterium hackensackense TaxID=228909 RepID=UPI002265B579|nr:helix-turn-helix transcriptional regulator [Mycobacterium hackensackense]